MAEIPKGYELVKDDWLKPLLKYALLSFTIIACIVLLSRSIKLAAMLLIWDFLALMYIHCSRTRYCPTCKGKMDPLKDNFFAVVEYHTCEKCKVAISTNVKNEGWA